jgi:isoprenylcysteine carboxyl methyltransferase (ICMT) family protein YpbQ
VTVGALRVAAVAANVAIVSLPITVYEPQWPWCLAVLVCASALCWFDTASVGTLTKRLPCVIVRADERRVHALCGATAASVLLVFWFAMAGAAPAPAAAWWIGAACIAAGVALRGAAIRTLGEYFVNDIQWIAGQRRISRGPYRLCAHPGDYGLCLAVGGAALASGNARAMVVWMCTLVPATLVRTRWEDRAVPVLRGRAGRWIHRFGNSTLTESSCFPRPTRLP